MSYLAYQNYNNKSQGWTKPSLSFGPEIVSLTGYQSPAGSNTLISIIGNNFYSYSTINFGTFTPTVFFISSSLISFYVPNTLYPGTYTVMVCNGSNRSNIVNYTIDMSSGFWLLNSGGSISNTNNKGVSISWLSRGEPLSIEDGQYTNPSTSYIVPDNINWIICNSNSDIYITLPFGSQYNGREITFKKTNPNGAIPGSSGNVFSTSSNVSLLTQPTNYFGNTILLAGSGNWCKLVYNSSTNIWITMEGNTPVI